MNTRIKLPEDKITADVSRSADGNAITVAPLFRMPSDTPTVAYIDSVVTDSNGAPVTLHRYLLVQSGKDAKLRLLPCSRTCKPRFYQQAKPKTEADKKSSGQK